MKLTEMIKEIAQALYNTGKAFEDLDRDDMVQMFTLDGRLTHVGNEITFWRWVDEIYMFDLAMTAVTEMIKTGVDPDVMLNEFLGRYGHSIPRGVFTRHFDNLVKGL